MMIVAGQTITWGLKVYNTASQLADPGGGTPTGVVVRPDATTGSAVVGKVATGDFSAVFASTLPGRYQITWNASGTDSGGFPYVDYADVVPASPALIVPLAEARSVLNLPTSSTVNDDELLGVIIAAGLVVEHYTGPILPATRTEVHDGDGGTALFLYAYPNSVTEVKEDGVVVDPAKYGVSKGGVLWRLAGSWSALTPANIEVTYQVGLTTIPENVLKAAREEIRFLWQMGQTGARPSIGGMPAAGTGYVAAGYAVPNRVIELLAGDVGRYKPIGE